MKPFKECPGCHSKFEQINRNVIWWEESCSNDNCDLNYRQYFPTSFEDKELKYFQFYTKTFYLYVYLTKDNVFPGEIHVYHKIFPRGEDTQMPCLKLKKLDIDFNNLDKLEDKLKTLSTFS